MTTTRTYSFAGLRSVSSPVWRSLPTMLSTAGSALVAMLFVSLSSTAAIAQSSPPSADSATTPPDELPTPNAGSADLTTEPAGRSAIQLVEPQSPSVSVENAEDEVNQNQPQRVFERGERYGEPGPAQADRVEFLLD